MAIEVFISYSHRDQTLRDELEKHLSNLKEKGFNWCRVLCLLKPVGSANFAGLYGLRCRAM